MIIYLAAPLFTTAERNFNEALAYQIKAISRGDIQLFLPQKAVFPEPISEAYSHGFIYRGCIDAIKESDGVLAVLDGSDADSGTSFEVGYAVAIGKNCWSIRTDFRGSGDGWDRSTNIMLGESTFMVKFDSRKHLLHEIAAGIVESIVGRQ